MALSLRTLALRNTLTATRNLTIARTFSTSNIFNQDSPAYPFTKDSNPTHKPASTRGGTPYPFTSSDAPKETTTIPPPTRPAVGRPGPSQDSSSSISSETQITQAREDIPHQPDYNAAYDYRTSSFSPVPMRVMDGSEPGDITNAAVLSGAPTELQARTVRIFQPAKTATQSGDWHAHHWQMDWDVLGKGHRWENPVCSHFYSSLPPPVPLDY